MGIILVQISLNLPFQNQPQENSTPSSLPRAPGIGHSSLSNPHPASIACGLSFGLLRFFCSTKLCQPETLNPELCAAKAGIVCQRTRSPCATDLQRHGRTALNPKPQTLNPEPLLASAGGLYVSLYRAGCQLWGSGLRAFAGFHKLKTRVLGNIHRADYTGLRLGATATTVWGN